MTELGLRIIVFACGAIVELWIATAMEVCGLRG